MSDIHSSGAAPQASEASAHRMRGVGSLMTALLAACVAFQLNASMLSPVLVTMAKELGTDEATVGLSQTVFFTAAAVFSLFLPRFSDIVGRKRVLTWMIGIMTVGTIVAALAPNIHVLMAGRALQGVSGPTVPVALLMLRKAIDDPRRYGTLMGLVTAVNGGIAGIDALLGGWLATNFGFRSVFAVIAVIAAIATVMIILWAPESRPSRGIKMDWWGVIALSASLICLMTAFNEAGKLGDMNVPLVLGGVVLGIIAFAIFWAIETRSRHALVTTGLLKRRSTWGLLATTLLTMTGVFAVINGLVTSIAQNPDAGFGLDPDYASLITLTPYALLGWAMGPISGWLAPRVGYRRVLRVGMVGSLIGIVLLAFIGVHSIPMLIVGAVLLGIAYAGTVNIMLNGLGVVLSPDENPGFLPGLNAAMFNLGAGLSFAILPAIQLIGSPSGSTSTSGYTWGMLAGLAIVGLGLLMSFTIPKPSGEVDEVSDTR